MGLAAKLHVATTARSTGVGEDGERYSFGTEAAKAEFLKDRKGHLEKARAFRGGGGAP